ncbi:MAG: hypothetical protein KAJ19_26160 [Gammaproteobacteria bacterium]|nr:hypothetical protein [Gammaproteobacteria bacterium]
MIVDKLKQDIPRRIQAVILASSRGNYQDTLIAGERMWSGCDTGPLYGVKYLESRVNLVKRINHLLPEDWTAATVNCKVPGERGQNKTRLVLTDLFGDTYAWED